MSASRTVTRIVDQDDAVAGKVPVALGGTGAGDAATARTNLGLGTVATHAVGEFLTPAGNGSALTGLTESQVAGLTADLAAKAPLASPALTGVPTVPTATAGTNTTQAASTAFVLANAGSGGAVTSVAGRTGAVVLAESDVANLTTDLASINSSLASKVTGVVLNTSGLIHTSPTTFTVASGTATGTQTLAVQTANTHLAGPTTGAAAAPTFRALVAADVPAHSAALLTSGNVPLAQLGTGTPAAGKYVDGAAGAWTVLPGGGSSGAGPDDVSVLVLPDGATYSHVTHGAFWDRAVTGTDLGSACWWDLWCRSGAPSAIHYMISAGYGGAHELLFGLNGVPGALTGNIWNGTALVSFGGDYQVVDGEWAHLAVGWDGAAIWTYVNGVPDGKVAFAGPRVTPTSSGGGGFLYVGGSTHENFVGALGYVRGWDRNFARGVGYNNKAFAPERAPIAWNADGLPPDFLCDYTGTRRPVMPDLSPVGFATTVGGTKVWHPGTVKSNSSSQFGPDNGNVVALPSTAFWEADPGCPVGRSIGSPLPVEATRTPRTPPGGCKVFDSFQRRNQTWAFQQAPDLGSTEAGSLGPMAWQQGNSSGESNIFGILGGHACALGHSISAAWVECGAADADVRVDRLVSGYNPGMIQLALRVVDGGHFLNLQVTNVTNLDLYVENGVSGTWFGGVTGAPPTWTTLRTVLSGSTITVYCDATLAGTFTGVTTYQTATKHGIGIGGYGTTTFNSLARWTNFTVF